MIQHGDKIVVAVSGGADSMCLLSILNHLKQQYSLSLYIAHINHGIRKEESKAELSFVRMISSRIKIPFESLSVSIPNIAKEKGLSIEQAGRDVRYKFFLDVLKKYQAQKVATGHHLDDQVETVLMRIIRGSGLQGLRGIPPIRNYFIRPLIECNQKEIIAYCKRNKIIYCFDSSNNELFYFRNKIRHQLIPLLEKEYNSSVRKNLSTLRAIVQDEYNFLEEITKKYYSRLLKEQNPQNIILDINQLLKLPTGLQRRIIREALNRLQNHLQNIQFKHIENIRELCLTDKGEKYLNLSQGIQIRKSYQALEFRYKKQVDKIWNNKQNNILEFKLPLCREEKYPSLGIKIKSQKYNISPAAFSECIKNKEKEQAYFDYDKLELPLKIRNRRQGDRFKPLNCNYFKKIKSYFIDLKIPLHERDNVLFVVDKLDRIVWIIGYQVDDRFKITKQSKEILNIKKFDL